MSVRVGYWLAIFLAFPAYWPRLVRSLWLDEAGTYWMARNGFWEGIERAAGFNGQSMLYAAVASWFCVPEGPWMEFLLRVPSVAGLAGLLYFTARLGRLVLGDAGGLCAFVFLLFHPVSLEIFSQARPYGLAAAAVAASFCLLYEWVEKRAWRWAAGYGLAVALVWYLHYLYVAVLGAQLVYLAWVFFVGGRRGKWGQMAAALAGAGALGAPLAAQFLRTAEQAKEMSNAPSPDLLDFGMALAPMPMAGLAVALLAVGAVLFRERGGRWPAADVMVLWGGWWLLAPLVFFLASQGESVRLFMTRYLGSSAGAWALVLAAVGGALFSSRVLVGGALAVALLLGGPLGWRSAAQPTNLEALPMVALVRGITPQAPPPVFFHSSLVESNSLPWKLGPEGAHAFAELAAYPIRNRVFGLPVNADAEVVHHVQGILDGELAGAPLVVFVKGGPMPRWVVQEMEGRGYQLELARPNAYSVGIFRRNPVR